MIQMYHQTMTVIFVLESISFENPNLLFQMTGARKHPCKQAGIHKVLNLLRSLEDPLLYFIVPKDCFSSFKYQKYQGSDGEILKDGPSLSNVKKVKQCALEIDLVTQKFNKNEEERLYPLAVERLKVNQQ